MATPTPKHVIVVGAGIVGASIAWHLAVQHGVRVTVVASDVGGTATPNSFCWLNANFNNPRYYFDFRRRSMAHWRELASGGDDSGSIPGLHRLINWTGTVQWDGSPDQLAKDGEQNAIWGYDMRRIVNTEIVAANCEPWLADTVLPAHGWAWLIGEEGSVEAAAAARLMVAHARESHGARLVLAKVARLSLLEGLDTDSRNITGVVTSTGELLTADHVVLAAGLGIVPLCNEIGLKLPVSGRPGLLVHSKPLPQRILRGIVISQGPHIRQTAENDDGGGFRIVAGANFAGSDPGREPQAKADALFAAVRAMFRPTSSDGRPLPPLELDYYTIGHRPDPHDGLPILGSSGHPGLTLAVMHSGVTLAAIVGQIIADLVVTGREDPALSTFALNRFKEK